MSDLAADLEAAEQGSRELSDRVLLSCGWEKVLCHGIEMLKSPTGEHCHAHYMRPPPSPTESVDDGLALLRELGWKLVELSETMDDRPTCQIWHSETDTSKEAEANTLETALTAALVRAADQQKGGGAT